MGIRPNSLLVALAFASILLFGCILPSEENSQSAQPAKTPALPPAPEEIPARPAEVPAPGASQQPTSAPGNAPAPPFEFPNPGQWQGMLPFGQQPPANPDAACQKPSFTEYFVDPDYLMSVGQVGTVHGSGRFIVERSYLAVKEEFNRKKVPIYAPADMALARGAYYQVPPPPGQYLGEPLPDYAVYFDAGCGVEIAFGHLKEMVPSIAQQFSSPKQDSRTEQLKRIEFKAGELIGYYIPGAGVAAFDFMAYDPSVTNQFANQKRYEYGYGSTLLHAVCPYDFYSGRMKDAYYGLIGGKAGTSAAKKECGPISRDYPGTISGMWFLDKEAKGSIYDYSQNGVYGSALPIAGDIDRVIIGTIGRSAAYFIYPSNPTYKDPKEVNGMHCYELYQNGNPSQDAGFVFFEPSGNSALKVFYSDKGECPASFPPSGGAMYYR